MTTSTRRRGGERYLAALIEQSSDIIVAIDRVGRLIYVSRAVERILGLRRAWRGLGDAFALVHPEDRARVERDFAEKIDQPEAGRPIVFRMRHADGSWRHLEATGTNLLEDPDVEAIVVNLRDVTQRADADAEVRASEQRYQRLVEVSPHPIAIHQDDRIVFMNPSGLALLGASEPDDVIGQPVERFVHPSSVGLVRDRMADLVATGASAPTVEEVLLRVDGTPVQVEVAAVPTAWNGRPAVQVVARDIGERKAAELALRHQASHDSLTGLPNRDQVLALLRDRLALELDDRYAVAFLDLDRFKVVNDALGHAIGDEILVAVADRLRQGLAPTDTLARFGGDEFVVLLDEVDGPEEAERRVRRLLSTLQVPMVVAGRRIDLTCSAGIAMAGGADSATELLRDADTAMYGAKRQGRSRVQHVDHEQRRAAAARLDLEEQLRHGFERDELVPWFQPEVELATGVPVGAEALVRWDHPTRGRLSPGEFLPVAEDAGLLARVTGAVLGPACAAVARWRRDAPGLWVSVNVTEADLLDGGFHDRVDAELDRHGLPGGALCLEVSESSLIVDPAGAARTISSLRSRGVTIAIDDFGTGYSSLSYLKRFEPDFLKIDRSLVAGVAGAASDRALVRAAIDVAKALGIVVIAEGVEHDGQRDALLDLGCDLAQGWLFGAPRPDHGDQGPRR